MTGNLSRPWLDIATEDLVVARLVASEEHFAHACFLAQQCIEKSLKAYLVAQTGNYPRVHKLVDLLGQCRLLAPDFAQFVTACTSVDQYYIPTRYPEGLPGGLPSGPPSRRQAEAAIAWAQEILDYVNAQLP